jgi:hypothetical protein
MVILVSPPHTFAFYPFPPKRPYMYSRVHTHSIDSWPLPYFTAGVQACNRPHCKDAIPKIRKKIFPEKELRGLSPNFYIHVSVSNLYIFPQSVCLFCCRKICGPILEIYNSLTDTWMWKLGLRPHNSFSGNTLMGFSLQCSLDKQKPSQKCLATTTSSSPYFIHHLKLELSFRQGSLSV